MAHITGGGLSNLLRLHDQLGWHIDNPLPILPEFQWLAEQGLVNNKEIKISSTEIRKQRNLLRSSH